MHPSGFQAELHSSLNINTAGPASTRLPTYSPSWRLMTLPVSLDHRLITYATPRGLVDLWVLSNLRFNTAFTTGIPCAIKQSISGNLILPSWNEPRWISFPPSYLLTQGSVEVVPHPEESYLFINRKMPLSTWARFRTGVRRYTWARFGTWASSTYPSCASNHPAHEHPNLY